MKWYKHDSNAHNDAKLKRVKHKFGITGYGIYWYCIELIASKVDKKNLSFELEEDAELIAIDWGLEQPLVENILDYFVEIALFERNTSAITCFKLAKRLDDTNSKNPEIKSILFGLTQDKPEDSGASSRESENSGASSRESEDSGASSKESEDSGASSRESEQTTLDQARNNGTLSNNTSAVKTGAGEFAQFGLGRFNPSLEDMAYCESLELAEPLELIIAHFKVHHSELMTLTTESHWSRLFRGWVEKNRLPPSIS